MDTLTRRKPSHGVLTGHYTSLSASINRLSSGLRSTETSRSDALDCSIRALMRSDISALQQGVKNANDAISLLQTALFALRPIKKALGQMDKIAHEASEPSPATSRSVLERDYQDLAQSITEIATTTEFQGLRLLDGSLDGDDTHSKGLFLPGVTKRAFGRSEAVEETTLVIGAATAAALGVGSEAGADAPAASVATQAKAIKARRGIAEAMAKTDEIVAHVKELQSLLEHTITTLTVHSQNLQSIETRISDVDVANEMTLFVKQQILTNSAVAMLSQASPISEMAMTLVR